MAFTNSTYPTSPPSEAQKGSDDVFAVVGVSLYTKHNYENIFKNLGNEVRQAVGSIGRAIDDDANALATNPLLQKGNIIYISYTAISKER